MKRVGTALGLVLALAAFMPRESQAQDTRAKKADATLRQNYPNPFNPETKIPFSVGDPPSCTDNGKQYRVSLKVYNVLSQLVAVPVLQGQAQSLDNVTISCGEYTAYWDGKVLNTGREAASGVYYYRLEVNGVSLPLKRMLVAK
ncbi:MAG: hypothetical protein IPP90_12360 [Gemmatimonadaceae bacterium]|nr:hypothetical protein [Gemmatimonadaceae bacterium]